MDNLVLYRKYRPQNWEEIIGQEHIVRTLTNALKLGHVNHAYLFSGPYGIGKLELALDIAQNLLNLSLFEASDGYFYQDGLNIEEARQLKKKLVLSPLYSEHKVVIINNEKNIKKESANAMLKLLEEPAKDTIFFLITTNSFLILPTIRSRCYEMKFNYVNDKLIEKHLNTNSIVNLKAHWSGRPSVAKKLLEDKEYLSKLIDYKKDAEKFIEGSLVERFQIVDKYSKTNSTNDFLKIVMNSSLEGN